MFLPFWQKLIYFKVRITEGRRDTQGKRVQEKEIYLLVHTPDGQNVQHWARLKPGAKSLDCILYAVAHLSGLDYTENVFQAARWRWHNMESSCRGVRIAESYLGKWADSGLQEAGRKLTPRNAVRGKLGSSRCGCSVRARAERGLPRKGSENRQDVHPAGPESK